jgi:hypothetical protein
MIKAKHRVAIHLRVSTLDQTTANQERELREVASRGDQSLPRSRGQRTGTCSIAHAVHTRFDSPSFRKLRMAGGCTIRYIGKVKTQSGRYWFATAPNVELKGRNRPAHAALAWANRPGVELASYMKDPHTASRVTAFRCATLHQCIRPLIAACRAPNHHGYT